MRKTGRDKAANLAAVELTSYTLAGSTHSTTPRQAARRRIEHHTNKFMAGSPTATARGRGRPQGLGATGRPAVGTSPQHPDVRPAPERSTKLMPSMMADALCSGARSAGDGREVFFVSVDDGGPKSKNSTRFQAKDEPVIRRTPSRTSTWSGLPKASWNT